MSPRLSFVASYSSPVATGLLIVCTVGAVIAAATAVPVVASADPSVQGVELWRLVGYLTFAALFLILARNPDQPALWAVVIASKAALPLAALTVVRGADESGAFLVADGVVTLLLLVAYVLSRGTGSRPPANAAEQGVSA